MRKARSIVLDADTRKELERLSRSRSESVRLSQRSTIVLLAAAGLDNETIGAELGITRQKAGRWRSRFAELGLEGILKEEQRSGRPLSISQKKKAAIVRKTLDRTQPGQRKKKGRCSTMTHDYKRNGTTKAFAALNTLNGSVNGTCMPKHRHQEWIRFLNLIKRNTSTDKTIHIICDNYATHKHAKVASWLKRNKRFHVHFTPTSASWLNMVERFFRDISERRLRRGVFRSVEELVTAVTDYVARHNDNPKPFIWTATASDILEKVKRARKKLDKLQSL